MESGDDNNSIKRMKMKNEERVEGDRIINLPKHVLHHVLSVLDMKDVVQTSILSKEWKNVWMSLPFLNFDCRLFHSKTTRSWHDPVALENELATESLEGERFKHFVDEVLLLRGSSNINSFRLCTIHSVSGSCDINSRLYSWILAAVRRNVQELFLTVSTDWCTGFPHCIFTCEELRVLDLISWDYFFDLSLPDYMSLPKLKTLCLDRLSVDATRILSSCPVLETLTINECYFSNNVEIYAPNLEQLVISDSTDSEYLPDKTMKLYAPNLISLCFCGDIFKDYLMENLSTLVEAEIDIDFSVEKGSPSDDETSDEYRQPAQRVVEFLRAFQNVEDLEISLVFLESVSGALHLLESTSIQLRNLTCLRMEVKLAIGEKNAIAYLIKISPNIESLFLDITSYLMPKCPYWDEVISVNSASTEVPIFDAEVPIFDHLKFVDIQGVEGSLNELMFLENLLKNAMVLEKVILHASKGRSPYTNTRVKFTEKLLTLPRASSIIEILLV